MATMKDAQVISKELLVDSFKQVLREKIKFQKDDAQDWICMDTPLKV
jgi:hypothetical protein